MKTFRLVSLEMVEDNRQDIETKELPLLEGLIINREDEKNQWVIEAYLENGYWNYLQEMKEKDTNLLLHAKISKPTNRPATFLCEIIAVNEIEENMNVLFLGTLVDEKKDKVENKLKELIDKGYQGEQLLAEFRKEV